jgi:anti-sigma regulatory factor (Ser/Thr protein kinase)
MTQQKDGSGAVVPAGDSGMPRQARQTAVRRNFRDEIRVINGRHTSNRSGENRGQKLIDVAALSAPPWVCPLRTALACPNPASAEQTFHGVSERQGGGVEPIGDTASVDAAEMAFDASAESVAQARRMAGQQLISWELSELADDARLVVSELLTNAALHAKPPIRMRLLRITDGVRIEVSDGSREMPLLIRASPDVMTGRGWSLVQALAHEWGAERAPSAGGGKTVWATMLLTDRDDADPRGSNPDDGVERSHLVEADLLALFPDLDDDAVAQRYEVILGDVPTDLLVAAKAHIDALIREFALLASGAAVSSSTVPMQLTTLIQRVVSNFAEARQSIKKQAVRSAQAHDPRTRLALNLPLSAADAGRAYLAALDEVDAYCRAEQMLTLETPPAHRVFRRWYVEELIAGLGRASDPVSADAARLSETFESRLLREYEELSIAHSELLRSTHRVG